MRDLGLAAIVLIFGFLTCLDVQLVSASASKPHYHTLPSLREQAKLEDAWADERIARIPSLLRKYGVDAWLITQREYAEDTLFRTLKRATVFSARRRTTTLFLAHGEPTSHTWVDNTPALWLALRSVLSDRKVQRLAVNADKDVAFSSGLHVGELAAVMGGLGEDWMHLMLSEPMIGMEHAAWAGGAERRTWYRQLMETVWAMVAEAFSEAVISPGETTTTDVEWWLREKYQALNMTTWFHPSVSIVDGSWSIPGSDDTVHRVIRYGDLLHVDFGVTALGLNTDTQHLGYVLYPGETEADVPKGFVEGLRKGNRMQDIVKENMAVGKTGDEILKACLVQMEREGIEGKVYSHPIGNWGHSAGTLIGMTNLQDGVPVLGEFPLLPETFYSVELMAEHYVEERNATYSFPLEEDIGWVGGDDGWAWILGRQEKFHLVRTPGKKSRPLQAQQGDL